MQGKKRCRLHGLAFHPLVLSEEAASLKCSVPFVSYYYVIEFSKSTEPLTLWAICQNLGLSSGMSIAPSAVFLQVVSLGSTAFFQLYSRISLVLNVPMDYTVSPLWCQG